MGIQSVTGTKGLHCGNWIACAGLAALLGTAAAADPPEVGLKAAPNAPDTEIRALIAQVEHAGYYGLQDPQEKQAIARLQAMPERAAPAVAAMLADGLRRRKSGWIEVNRPLHILNGMGAAGAVALGDVIRALDDEHPINVGAAALVLAGIGPKARPAVPALLRAWERRKDSSKFAEGAVAKAIRSLDPDAARKAGIP
jgi:hypothetical protein